MLANLITVEDLENFRQSLLADLQRAFSENKLTYTDKWLKSHQVRKLLTISPGTLQNLRVNGILPFTKIGGVIFYDYEDIRQMIEQRKENAGLSSKKANRKKTNVNTGIK